MMKQFYTLHIPPQGHKASIQHQKRFWLVVGALTRRSLGDFSFFRQPLQNRVPGNACSRRRWRIQRAGVGAAVEKIEERRQPEDFFGHRKRGCEATSSPSAPAKQERPPPVRRPFLFYRAKENPRHAERAGQRLLVPPVADTASRGWRSGRKNRGKAAARRFFRAPQEGLRSNFEPFCPCHCSKLLFMRL